MRRFCLRPVAGWHDVPRIGQWRRAALRGRHPSARQTKRITPQRPFWGCGKRGLGSVLPGCGKYVSCPAADGRELDKLYIPAGGARMPASERPEPSRRMMTEAVLVPLMICIWTALGIFVHHGRTAPTAARSMRFSGREATGIDYFVMHQANRYIIETVAKKSAIPAVKAPSATFALRQPELRAYSRRALCGELASVARQRDLTSAWQGFGVGLRGERARCVCASPVAWSRKYTAASCEVFNRLFNLLGLRCCLATPALTR